MKKYLTPDGLEKLKKELKYLKEVRRKEVAEKLERSISFGDLSENAEYSEAKEDQAFLEGRIIELGNLIKNATIVDSKKNIGVVQIGSIISVNLVGSSKEIQKFKIVGIQEAAPSEGKISIDSPFGTAVLNKARGAMIQVDAPGKKLQYKILKIE